MGCMCFLVDLFGDFFLLDYDFVEIFEKGINVMVMNSLIIKCIYYFY